MVAGYFFRKGCPEEDVRDLVQETGLQAWRSYSQLQGDFKSWSFGIARNTFSAYLRKRSRELEIVEESLIADSRGNPEKIVLANILMDQCLGELTKKERECLVLHDYHGHNYKKIAEMLGISLSNAHYHVEKARSYLQEKYPELVVMTEKIVGEYDEERRIQGLPVLN